jgi:DNA-binding response OmpR family regulator
MSKGTEFENRREGALNECSDADTDQLFGSDGFFDPTDLVQVKYEMLRRVAVDGVSIREAARASGLSPRIFYHAKAGFEQHGVVGLLGPDPYPSAVAFVQKETGASEESQRFAFSDDYLRIDFERRTVRAGEKVVRLTRTEFALLFHLVSRASKPLPHQELEQLIWGTKCVNRRASLRVYVNQLRKKIEPDPVNPRYIVTEPWVGYRFKNFKNE